MIKKQDLERRTGYAIQNGHIWFLGRGQNVVQLESRVHVSCAIICGAFITHSRLKNSIAAGRVSGVAASRTTPIAQHERVSDVTRRS